MWAQFSEALLPSFKSLRAKPGYKQQQQKRNSKFYQLATCLSCVGASSLVGVMNGPMGQRSD